MKMNESTKFFVTYLFKSRTGMTPNEYRLTA